MTLFASIYLSVCTFDNKFEAMLFQYRTYRQHGPRVLPNVQSYILFKCFKGEQSEGNAFYLSDRTDNFLRLAEKTFGIDAQWELVRLED